MTTTNREKFSTPTDDKFGPVAPQGARLIAYHPDVYHHPVHGRRQVTDVQIWTLRGGPDVGYLVRTVNLTEGLTIHEVAYSVLTEALDEFGDEVPDPESEILWLNASRAEREAICDWVGASPDSIYRGRITTAHHPRNSRRN